MDKILLLIGASGSGKTTVAKELEKLGYNIIPSYTTRPPRTDDEWGHKFVKKVPKDKSKFIAYFEGYDYAYWATKSQYKGKGISIYVIDPVGADEVRGNLPDTPTLKVHIKVPMALRAKRLLKDRPVDVVQDRLRRDMGAFENVNEDFQIDGSKSVDEIVGDIANIIEGWKNESPKEAETSN